MIPAPEWDIQSDSMIAFNEFLELSIVSPLLAPLFLSILSRLPVPCQHVPFRDRSPGITVGVPVQQAVGTACVGLKQRLRVTLGVMGRWDTRFAGSHIYQVSCDA